MNRMLSARSAVSPLGSRSLIVAIAALTALLGLAGCERWALDRQMEELCKRDGGVKVYETVTLPASYFDNAGGVKLGSPMPQAVNNESDKSTSQQIGSGEYRLVRKMSILNDGDPLKGQGVLGRWEQLVIRTRDNKVLGTSISYDRIGGDFIVIDHWSSATCPTPAPQPLIAVFKRES